MAGKTVVVLGAGIGGLVAANELRRRLGREHRIIVIDRDAEYRFQSSYLWVMMGWRRPASVSRPLSRLRSRGIDFRQGDVQQIDLVRRRVETSAGPIDFDSLVVALGAELVPEGVPGMAEAGATPYTLEGATSLRDAWRALDEGTVAVVVASMPFKCPAAPYEAALLLEAGFRKRGVRPSVDIEIITPEPQPMPVAGPTVGESLRQVLAARGVNYRPTTKVTSIDLGAKELTFEGGGTARYDLLVYVPVHRSPAVVRESGLAGETGWIPVDPRTLETGHPHVYAIGDVAAVKLPNGMMLPKAGVFAHGEAEIVADRIAASISGRKSGKEFDGWGACFIEMGEGKAGYGSGNFFAEPAPAVALQNASRSWRLGKVMFEKAWLATLSGSPAVASAAFRGMDLWGRTLLERHWLWRWV
jgi:sulfide:quinone oxidoreductase